MTKPFVFRKMQFIDRFFLDWTKNK